MLKDEHELRIFKNIDDFNTKSALAIPLDFIVRNNNGTPINILTEPLTTTPVVMYFRKNSFLTKRFSDMIQNMMASGLIEYWINNERNSKITSSDIQSEPKVMTMKNLLAPFILCVAGLLISTVTFLLEKIYFHYHWRRLINQGRRKVFFNS